MQLVVGKPGMDGCKFFVRQLHSSFGNKDRVAYFRREILEELGVPVPCHGDMSIGLMQFHQTFGTTVVKSSSMQFSNMHISWATQFMAERVADFEDLSGRKIGGTVTDATYSYFRHGYLLTSAVYCVLLKRWVPVLFTWTSGLTVQHHEAHFSCLLNMIVAAICSLQLSTREQELQRIELCFGAVMDFSEAQRNGFIKSYVTIIGSFMNTHGLELVDESLSERANRFVKGCHVHFLSSAERLNRNYSVVGKHDNGEFMAKIRKLIQEPVIEVFNSAIEELQSEYPNAAKWFEWWLRDAVARLIFACK